MLPSRRFLLCLASISLFVACDDDANPIDPDVELRALLTEADVAPLELSTPDPKLVALGEVLFFDKILSGNKDTACASCHHPLAASGDDLSLPFGTGSEGIGSDRELGAGRDIVPRNAPEIFNRGAKGWTTMFWDNRIMTEPELISPAGSALPATLNNASPVAIQAMFPVTSDAEMRGTAGDLDVFGEVNEIANINADDVTGIWAALMVRVLNIPEYQTLFTDAFPQVASPEFSHAALAIGAYEEFAFAFADSPFDQYIAGDNSALSDRQKRGATLFYGKAGCATCHSGPLMTDQKTHNVATPQLGPGKDVSGNDFGAMAVTGNEEDRYAFRTPPLRNVEITGPWTHAGAYTSLEAMVRHELNPEAGLKNYDSSQLITFFQDTLFLDQAFIDACIAGIDSLSLGIETLSEEEIGDLVEFLISLTDPAAKDLSALIPTTVPSGLPVDL